MRFQFVQALWGKAYVEHFLGVALPACATPGNILAFTSDEAELDIYTTLEDAVAIQSAPIIQALAAVVDVRVTTLDAPVVPAQNEQSRYSLMNAMHAMAMQRSEKTDSVVCFLAPDAVIANGTLARVRDLVRAGKRVVMMGTRRLSSAPFLREFRSRFGSSAMNAPIGPRELIDFAVRHPHEGLAGFHWGNPELGAWPSHLYFPVGSAGFVMYGFHLHPMAIYPRNRLLPSGSMDDAWLSELVPDPNDWHIMQDSDEGFATDFGTAPDERWPVRERADPYLHVATWAKHHASHLQWFMASHPIIAHANPITSEWQAVVEESQAVMHRILGLISTAPDWQQE